MKDKEILFQCGLVYVQFLVVSRHALCYNATEWDVRFGRIIISMNILTVNLMILLSMLYISAITRQMVI